MHNRGLVFVVALPCLLGACDMLDLGRSEPPPPPVQPGAGVPVPPTPGAVAPPEGAAPAAPPSGPSPEELSDSQMSRKLNEYINKCLNRFSERALRSRARYLSWADAERGPSSRSRHVYGLFEISDPTACREGVAAAATMSPDVPELQAAAQEYVDSLTALHPLVARAHTYYDRDNHEDDDFAQGREMHPGLIAAFERFDTAHTRLDDLVGAQRNALDGRELARLEASGKNGRYYTLKLLVDARALMDRANGVTTVSALPDDFAPRVLAFEELLDQAKAHAQTGFSEEEGGGVEASDLRSVCSSAEDFLQVAKELMRRGRDGEDFSRSDRGRLGTSSGWMVSGSPDRMSREFNNLVGAFNRI